jgi:hypothetical protein
MFTEKGKKFAAFMRKKNRELGSFKVMQNKLFNVTIVVQNLRDLQPVLKLDFIAHDTMELSECGLWSVS